MHLAFRLWIWTFTSACGLAAGACASAGTGARDDAESASVSRRRGKVIPGIEVLLTDSIALVRGKRIGLLTNQTGVDRTGESDLELLRRDPRATKAGVRVVALFAPEHGIRGTEDREFLESSTDTRTGLQVYSLYGATALAPPDSTLKNLDALVFDLQDIGTRTWTYVGNLVYALRAARRNGVRVVVLDRPAPLGGIRVEGPMLDSAIANADEHSPSRPALPYALYPFPLRHGMTIGELARFYNAELRIGADLVVVPMRHWRRAMWFDDTGLRWVRPSPSLPSLASAITYPALVAFEATNVSVGRGTSQPFQRLGAPWLDARRTRSLLEERGLAGIRFELDSFTPRRPADRKYDGQSIPGIRIVVTNRGRVHVGRLGAALVWAIARTAGDSLRVDARAFDLRFGSADAREALLRGDDPDGVIDRSLGDVVDFTASARRYYLYK